MKYFIKHNKIIINTIKLKSAFEFKKKKKTQDLLRPNKNYVLFLRKNFLIKLE